MFEGFWLRYVVEVIGTYRGCVTMRLLHMVDVRIYGILFMESVVQCERYLVGYLGACYWYMVEVYDWVHG
jgi:hypothetical protein